MPVASFTRGDTREPVAHGLDVVGPVPLILCASSSALDKHFAGLSPVAAVQTIYHDPHHPISCSSVLGA